MAADSVWFVALAFPPGGAGRSTAVTRGSATATAPVVSVDAAS